MKPIFLKRRNVLLLTTITAILVSLYGCSHASEKVGTSSTHTPRLNPAFGTYFGVNLDWDNDSPAVFNQSIGHHAAIFVQFCKFPLAEVDISSIDATVKAVASEGGMVMITLEPWDGLKMVTPEAADIFADKAAEYNAMGVKIFVRFAHEMNGSWYPWSQQPSDYIKAFAIVADAIHSKAPHSAMLWAPNYGGGYPFKGGLFQIKPDNPDFNLVDTNNDGQLNMNDDPYRPYYPGDEAVDWVGISIYHWGNTYPWGDNEIPEKGKFIAELTGNYNGLNGNEIAIPDFYEVYYKGHGKPVAIPETAAFYDPDRSGSSELVLKQAWWRQVFDSRLLSEYPGIKMINWFEWKKPESEIDGNEVDWRVLASPTIAEQFCADLPTEKLVFAP